MRLWWDKGLLWVNAGEHQTLFLDSYAALDLIDKLGRELPHILAQKVLDDIELAEQKEEANNGKHEPTDRC